MQSVAERSVSLYYMIYMSVYACKYGNASVHACIRAYLHIYIHTCLPSYIHRHSISVCTHTYIHTYGQTRGHPAIDQILFRKSTQFSCDYLLHFQTPQKTWARGRSGLPSLQHDVICCCFIFGCGKWQFFISKIGDGDSSRMATYMACMRACMYVCRYVSQCK